MANEFCVQICSKCFDTGKMKLLFKPTQRLEAASVMETQKFEMTDLDQTNSC